MRRAGAPGYAALPRYTAPDSPPLGLPGHVPLILGITAHGERRGCQETLPRLAVLSRARNGCTRAGRHAGHVTWNGRSCSLSPPRHHAPRRSNDRTEGMEKPLSSPSTPGARFSKSRFPIRAVYGPIDHAGLRLITCGGTYDAAENTYLDNVVVFARLKEVRR